MIQPVRFLVLASLTLAACGEVPPEVEPPAPWSAPVLLGPRAVLEDVNDDPDIVEVHLRAEFTDVDLGDGTLRPMMTYNGVYPGPLLQAKVGDEVIVHFENQIWEPTTVHWHGLRISDEMDGSPRIQEPVAAEGGVFTYRFVVPDAGSYWYHPHVRTNEQLEFGLVGPIVVHDPSDPVFDAERYVVLDDILIDGSRDVIAPFGSHPEMVHGRNGNVLLTNGRTSPAETGAARPGQVERWRIVNTANARTMSLSLTGATLRVVGTDAGRLDEPFETDRLELPVGQRYDVEVHHGAEGMTVLTSHVLGLNEAGEVEEFPIPVYEVAIAGEPAEAREIVWAPATTVDPRTVDESVELRFDAVDDPDLGLLWRINEQAFPEEPLFTFPVGHTVTMSLANLAGQEHPFHLHGQFFEVVGRPGLYDTVLVGGGETVEIVAHLDNPGRWMAHCHILEHAELGMMAEIVIGE
ncbi:MAG: multicopper oxidase family protein [Sandaracinaceae bacterium]